MKHYLLIFISLIFISSTAYAQTSESESKLSLGIGVGPSYGVLGVKALIGSNHKDKLVLSLGPFGYSIGVQSNIYTFYANLNYGAAVLIKHNNDPIRTLNGVTLFFGKMVYFNSFRKSFLDLSIGRSFGVIWIDNIDGFTFNLGLNFTIPTKK